MTEEALLTKYSAALGLSAESDLYQREMAKSSVLVKSKSASSARESHRAPVPFQALLILPEFCQEALERVRLFLLMELSLAVVPWPSSNFQYAADGWRSPPCAEAP